MEFGEFMALVVLFVAFPWVLFTGIRNLRRDKLSAHASASESGMRVSELRALIREAVSEAVEPLEARVRALEEGARPEAPPAQIEAPRPLLDPADWDEEAADETAARAARRTRY